MESVRPSVRPAAVAGLFYPDEAPVLSAQVLALLAHAHHPALQTPPKALIVPHAGYVYSGAIAASAYALLEPVRENIRRVILLGPSHRVGFSGIALPSSTAFTTPLGEIRVDTGALAHIAHHPGVIFEDRAHAQEHALEVQLPFLQTVLDDFQIVPMTLGTASPATVADLLEALWGGPETLIVVSSDLSHYHAYAQAQELDRDSVRCIVALTPSLTPEQACGAGAINALLITAHNHGLEAALLDLRNSGDTAGDRNRVVGYAAIRFTPAPQTMH